MPRVMSQTPGVVVGLSSRISNHAAGVGVGVTDDGITVVDEDGDNFTTLVRLVDWLLGLLAFGLDSALKTCSESTTAKKNSG